MAKRINHKNVVSLQDVRQKMTPKTSVQSNSLDVVLVKIEKIEETQEKISSTVGSIHEAIYNPDNGLFSRINSIKSENIGELDKKIEQIEAWKQSRIKLSEEDKALKEKVSVQESKIEKLESWRGSINSVSKWLLVAIAGGGLSLGFRAFYELFLIK